MNGVYLVLAAAVMVLGSAAAEAKTLVFCPEASPEGFDPALYTSAATFDASSRPIYDRLVAYQRGTTNLTPGLAESWDISDDGRTYTFRLRPDVMFHTTDGFTPSRALNADDVIFSFKRQLDPAHPFHSYVEAADWAYFNGMSMPEVISSIERDDDLTVTFNLRRPEAQFLANLAMPFASILSREYADQLAASDEVAALDSRPVGTGPFRFVGYEPDASVRFAAFDDHWAGRPSIDDLIFEVTVDGSVRRQKLEAGQCDVAAAPNPPDLASLAENPDITVQSIPALDVGYLAYNTMQPPFDNAAVRKALNMAIDKQVIVDAVFESAGVVAKGPIPPTVWSYDETADDDAYDPEEAREMLAATGVGDLAIRIWAMPASRPYMPDGERVAALIQSDLAAIGVDAEIVTSDWSEYLESSKVVDRDGAVLLGWTGDNGDPDNFLSPLLGCEAVGGSNRAQWCNDGFDKLIRDAKATTDQSERAVLYREAQAIFRREAPWATLAHSVDRVPMRAAVTGYVIDPLGGHWFDGVDIAE